MTRNWVCLFDCFVKHKEAEGVSESTPNTRCGRKCPWKRTHASRAHQHQGFIFSFLVSFKFHTFTCYSFVGVVIMGLERLVFYFFMLVFLNACSVDRDWREGAPHGAVEGKACWLRLEGWNGNSLQVFFYFYFILFFSLLI